MTAAAARSRTYRVLRLILLFALGLVAIPFTAVMLFLSIAGDRR